MRVCIRINKKEANFRFSSLEDEIFLHDVVSTALNYLEATLYDNMKFNFKDCTTSDGHKK